MYISPDIMTVQEFIEHHLNDSNDDSVVQYVIGADVVNIDGDNFAELVPGDEDDVFIKNHELRTQLLKLDQNLFVVMKHPDNWNEDEYEYVVGTSGGMDDINIHCEED